MQENYRIMHKANQMKLKTGLRAFCARKLIDDMI